jgi:hypothetical protein
MNVFIFDDLAEARDFVNAIWMAAGDIDEPSSAASIRLVADIAAKPDAVRITHASGQHRTNNRKSEMATASRS